MSDPRDTADVVQPEPDKFAEIMGPSPDFWDSNDEHVGHPHALVLFSYELPRSQFSDGEMEFEIEHPDTCKQEEVELWEGEKEMRWTCDVQNDLDNVGLPFTLRYSGTPITEPGRYRIQSWQSRIYVWDAWAYEYDGGIGVMGWDQPDHGRQPLTDEDWKFYRDELGSHNDADSTPETPSDCTDTGSSDSP